MCPSYARNVPKYFTPLSTFKMLMEKPTVEVRRLVRMNGHRNLRVSEKCAKNSRKNPGKITAFGMVY